MQENNSHHSDAQHDSDNGFDMYVFLEYGIER